MISRRVDLPSGGYLIIDYAEALTVIDINTGSYTGKGKAARLEDTITRTNLEAAEEVVNQLRLRDIGGIIVIDFIDMARARNRDAVLKVLRKALDEDRTKTFVVEISPLGLVEMTRQNVTDGAREIMTKPCPTCAGEGVVKSEETIAIEAERRLRELVAEAGTDGPEAYLVRMNPKVSAYFTGDGARMLHGLEEETNRFFHFTGSEGLPLDHFAIVEEGGAGRDRGAERAVPRGRGGARRHRRAAHVLRGRRGREGRRLPDRGHRRASATSARRCWCGSSTPAAPAARAVLAEVAEEAAAATEERRKSRERTAKRVGGDAVASAQAAQAGDARGPGRRGADRGRRRPRRDRPGCGRRLRRGRGEAARAPAAALDAKSSADDNGAVARDVADGEARRPSPRSPRRTTTTRYNRSLGAAAAEADGAVRVRTPKSPPKPASDLSRCPKPPTQ